MVERRMVVEGELLIRMRSNADIYEVVEMFENIIKNMVSPK